MIIGITGGTGCGKTTVLALLQQYGATVLDCDVIYHDLLDSDSTMLAAIENRFSGTVTDDVLDRKKLGNVVFSDPAALLDLNRITHSAVKQKVLSLLPSAGSLAAIDAIGLFEGGLAELCDVTVAVCAPEDIRIRRLMARDSISEAYAIKRIRSQRPQEEFMALCDHTLTNDGTQAQFREKCLAFFRRLGIIEENA